MKKNNINIILNAKKREEQILTKRFVDFPDGRVLRLQLSMQVTWIWPLIWEDSTCKAAKTQCSQKIEKACDLFLNSTFTETSENISTDCLLVSFSRNTRKMKANLF